MPTWGRAGPGGSPLLVDGTPHAGVIEAGSTARVKEVESLGAWSRAARKAMREQGVLVPDPGNPSLLRFTQGHAFDSPSAAAAVIAGTGRSGRVAWKVKDKGMSYKEWEESKVTELGEGEDDE